MAWTRLSASIEQVDWAAAQVTVQEVRADGVRMFVRRERDGGVSLASLIRMPRHIDAARDRRERVGIHMAVSDRLPHHRKLRSPPRRRRGAAPRRTRRRTAAIPSQGPVKRSEPTDWART